MCGNPEEAWHASWILRHALRFDRETAITHIERYWVPDPQRDGLTLQALSDLKEWDDRAIRLVETIVRRAPQESVFLRNVTDNASKSCPELAPRIVAAELWGALETAEAEPVKVPLPPPDDAPELDKVIFQLVHNDSAHNAVESIISDSSRWYELSKVAEAAPRAFVEQVWPCILHAASKYARAENKRVQAYQRDPVFDLRSDSKVIHHQELTSALEAGVVAFAAGAPERFLTFVNEQKGSDLLTIHRLLARGLKSLPEGFADHILQYVLADVRRLAIGPYSDVHRESRELITAIVSRLNKHARFDLERYILTWHYSRHDPDMDPSGRRDRLRWNRQHRLRLLRAFPLECLSSETAKLLEEEE